MTYDSIVMQIMGISLFATLILIGIICVAEMIIENIKDRKRK